MPTPRSSLLRALVVLALLLLARFGAAETLIRQPLVVPQATDEAKLLRDAVDGALDEHSLLEAALIASGAEQQERQSCQAKHRRWSAQLAAACRADDSPRDRAATLLAFLHREVLTGDYEPELGSLARTIETGDYNCVTATLLFCTLGAELGLDATALHLPAHVRVQLLSPPLEIEPTSRNGLLASTARASEPSRRPISPAALVAKLYYNQGVAAAARREHAVAIAAFDRSLLLDAGDATARQNLVAALSNGALALCDKEAFAEAARLLSEAARLEPESPLLAANELHLRARWAAALCQRGAFAEAAALLEEAHRARPSAELQAASVAVYRRWAEALRNRGETHAARARLEQGLALDPNHAGLLELRRSLP